MSEVPASIAPGLTATVEITVTPELTVNHVYPALPPVFATPQMIMQMEIAAAEAIAPALPEGWHSVGTRVEVSHLAATPVGAKVTATATVVELRGRFVRFAVEAFDENGRIGEGHHERAPVDLARFSAGGQASPP
ncbi:MAG: thioesterase family protein [Gammaproteobacteria bacterium]